MKFLINRLCLAGLSLVVVSCNLSSVQATREAPSSRLSVPYQAMLAKSVTDPVVAEFLTEYHCTRAAQFELCEEIGVALLINSNQMVEAIYFYLNNVHGFAPYQGELPYGLKFYDTMGGVVYKLKRQGVGRAGFPEKGDTPDHLHYNAMYERAHLIIIYNSPSPDDEDANMYAVVISD